MRSKPNLKGIIALSIDKLTRKENMILRVRNVQDIQPKLERLTTEFVRLHYPIWHRLPNINILAAFIFTNIVANIEGSPDLLTRCHQLDIDIIADSAFFQTGDKQLVIKLGRKLGATRIAAI